MDGWRIALPIRQLRARPLALFALCVLCGTVAAWRLDVPLSVSVSLCVGLSLVIALLAVKRRRFAVWVLLLGFGLGMVRMTSHLNSFPTVSTRYNVTMVGIVDTDPFTKPDTGRVIARFLPETVNDQPSQLRLRLYLRGDAEALSRIAYGQRLRLKAHIWANDPVTNPYEFDFGAFLNRNGMDAIATAKISDVTILGTERPLTAKIVELRHRLARRIDALFPKSAGMVRALMLGDRSLIGEELREALSVTGTAHLIAISGLHVAALAVALSALLRQFMSRRLANLIVLGPLLFYGALIGFSAPFVRALIMFGLFSFSQILGLPADPLTRLAAALLGYILVKPLAVGDGGFVLSFSASAGIILLMPPIRSLLRVDRLPPASYELPEGERLRRLTLSFVPELLCTSLAAQLATLPAVVAAFGVQSVVSIPFNLVCMPLCLLGYLLAMAALVVSAIIYPLGATLANIPDGLLSLLTDITRSSVDLPLTAIRIGRYPLLLILLHVAVIVAASELCLWPMNRRRLLPLALFAVAGLSSLFTWLNGLPFQVTFLDADQADCAILRTRGHVYVFDAGDTYTPAADYLSATCLHVDGVFLSHPHQDHAGGLTDILECFRPDAIYVPAGWFDQSDIAAAVTEGIDRARAMGIPIIELSAGDELALSPAARLTVYNPHAPFDDVNDMSLLLSVESEGHSVLFTGDLSAKGEPDELPDCDVLKVAHHGADDATSPRFLEATTPKIAVISVGENKHGHPAGLTLHKLKAIGAEILRTDERGAITLTATGDGWRVKTYREASHELD